MPRGVSKKGRGTRYTVGVVSGATFATRMSGVTIDQYGITAGVVSGTTFATRMSGVTIDQYGIDTGYGTLTKFTMGTVDHASSGVSRGTGGASNVLNFTVTGLSAITTFQGSILAAAAKNAAIGAGVTPTWTWYASGSQVTVYTFADSTPAKVFYSGASLSYLAFGT